MDRSSAGTNVSEAEDGEPSWRSLADPPHIRFVIRSRDLWRPVLIFAACRLIILLTIVAASFDSSAPVAGVLPKLRFWDGDFYVSIVDDWYPQTVPQTPDGIASQSSLAFFPLYPLLARGVKAVTPLGSEGSLLFVSAIAGLLATVLLWALVANLRNGRAADRATLLYAAFPGAFVWSMVYAEPVLAVFAISCAMALLGRRWWLAGLLAAIGSASRPNAIVLALPCVWAAGAAVWYRREWKAIVAAALAPIGWLAWLAYIGVWTGEPGAWFRIQREAWGETIDFGYRTLGRVKNVALWLLQGTELRMNEIMPTFGLVLVVLLIIAMWKWRPPILLWLSALGIVGLASVSAGLGLRPRFVHSAFPLVAAGGVELRGAWFVLVVALSLASQVALAYLSVTSTRAIP